MGMGIFPHPAVKNFTIGVLPGVHVLARTQECQGSLGLGLSLECPSLLEPAEPGLCFPSHRSDKVAVTMYQGPC